MILQVLNRITTQSISNQMSNCMLSLLILGTYLLLVGFTALANVYFTLTQEGSELTTKARRLYKELTSWTTVIGVLLATVIQANVT